MGYTQTLYEYTSAAANNGSDYFGTSANTPFWNWSTAIVMFLGRYIPLGLMLAIAGSFTIKDRKEVHRANKDSGSIIYNCSSYNDVLVNCINILSFSDYLVLFHYKIRIETI